MKSPHRKRIQVAISLLGDLVKRVDEIDRVKAIEILKETYESSRLEPIRGKSTPPDIYDKEIATLYIIGKYGLSLHKEHPELFEKIFYIEETLDSAIEDLLNDKPDVMREKLKKISPSGVVDGNTVARLLRLPLIRHILGFSDEDYFKNVIHKALKYLSEEEKTIRNYVKFFIGLKLAEAIYRGEVKSREEKEAYKKALAIRIGLSKLTPSDEYVEIIARNIFNVNTKILNKILKARSERSRGVGDTEDYHG